MGTENALAEDITPDPNAPADPPQDPPADPPSDPPADPPEDGEPPADPPPADGEPAKPSRLDERIGELVAERNATKEYADYWRQRYLDDIARQGQPAPADTQEKPAPKLADFEFDAAKWGDAYAKWAREDAARAARQAARDEVQQARTAETKQAAVSQWNQRLAEFAKTKPDAYVVVGNDRLPISEHMTEVITTSEKGPEIAYHLGTNPAEAARIARMTPAQQAAALGRLEATLSAPPPAPPKNKTSNAPPPPNPIDGAAAPGINLETCDLDTFLKQRLGKR